MTTFNGKSAAQIEAEEAISSMPLPNYTAAQPDEARMRRELAEVKGHQERLRKARAKRARKAAKRVMK